MDKIVMVNDAVNQLLAHLIRSSCYPSRQCLIFATLK